eukprot:ANDGO_01903.mRNA.1 hypothetical protein
MNTTQNPKLTRTDMIQLGMSIFKSLVSLYMILMGTLLAVFVPQSCPENGGDTCSLDQQFTDLTAFNKAVLGINFIALFWVLSLRALILFRERYIIEHFDEDLEQSDMSFTAVLAAYPVLQTGLANQNRRCFYIGVTASGIVVCNIILSLALVVIYWDGYRTGTVFATYTVLILSMTWQVMSVLSNPKFRTSSCLRSNPVCHNVVGVYWSSKNGHISPTACQSQGSLSCLLPASPPSSPRTSSRLHSATFFENGQPQIGGRDRRRSSF